MTPYECGDCGSRALRIVGVQLEPGDPDGWRVECGNGHAVAPSVGTAILAEQSEPRPSDPAEHPDHPHGSTVEQVHRILGQAYADEPDRWMLAEELVKFVTAAARREAVEDDTFVAAVQQAMMRPLTAEELAAPPSDRLSMVESLVRAGRLKPGRPSTIPEHLAEAERLLAFAFADNDPESAPGGYYDDDDYSNAQVAAAEVHARIAHAAAAAGMLRPPPVEDAIEREDAPGLAALENLAAAVGRIAAAWERDQESTFSGRRGPTE